MGTTRSAMIKREWLWNAVNAQGVSGLSYDEEMLISAFCLDQCSTRKTALELLEVFENTDKIIRRDGKIYSRRYFNNDLSIREEMFADEEVEKEAEEILDKVTENQKGVK